MVLEALTDGNQKFLGVAFVRFRSKMTRERGPHGGDRVSIALYLVLGWSGLVALVPLGETLSHRTLLLIVAGGVLYSLGVVFHLWQRLRFQNAIWHGFVLCAAACHYAAVLTTID